MVLGLGIFWHNLAKEGKRLSLTPMHDIERMGRFSNTRHDNTRAALKWLLRSYQTQGNLNSGTQVIKVCIR